MTRVPKFRGKSKETGEWKYGHLIVDGKEAFILNGVISASEEDIVIADWRPVELETVGQSTGLKDKNGVEIFEGDKCINPKYVHRNGEPLVFIVGKRMRYVHEWMFKGGELEVIRNIYENKELTKNEDNSNDI